MKIAFLTNFIPPYRRSLYQQITLKLEQVTFFISTVMEHNRNWEVNHFNLSIKVQKNYNYNKNWKHKNGFADKTPVHIPYDTIKQLKKYKPDVVVSAEIGIRSLLSSTYCKIYNKPLILWLTLSEHTETNKKGIRILLRKYLLKSSAALLCNGESGKRYVESLGIKKPVFYAPYTSDFKINEKGKNTFNTVKKILFTGQLTKRKGVFEMVEALKKWAYQNPTTKIELIVAGNGLEKNHFNLLNNITNIKVKLLGTVAYADLEQLYNDVDLYLFPTLSDEWGVVVNEALSKGVPVIGSLYSQAVEELIENDKNGWLFYPNQQDSFVKTLTKAINTNNSKLTELSENGISTIKDFTPEKIAANIVEAIQFVLTQKTN